MIISISGDVGSGKSILAKKLAGQLGFKKYSSGAIWRRLAKERGMNLEKFNKLGERDSSADRLIDDYQKKLGEKKDNFIIDGRLSFYFIPHSIKIHLKVSPAEGGRRIWHDFKNKLRKGEIAVKSPTLKEAISKLKARQRSERKRYKKYYQIDVADLKNYDLVVETTSLTVNQVFKKVWQFLKRYPASRLI